MQSFIITVILGIIVVVKRCKNIRKVGLITCATVVYPNKNCHCDFYTNGSVLRIIDNISIPSQNTNLLLLNDSQFKFTSCFIYLRTELKKLSSCM